MMKKSLKNPTLEKNLYFEVLSPRQIIMARQKKKNAKLAYAFGSSSKSVNFLSYVTLASTTVIP